MGKILGLTIVRHGETALNVTRVLQGHSDIPLTDVGKKQAEHLGTRLRSLNVTYTTVFASDLSRARQTAELILHHSGANLPIREDMRLRERCYGSAEGKPTAELFEKAKQENKSVHDYTPHGGESGAQVTDRIQLFLEDLYKLRDGEKNENVLLVTHGGWIMYFMKHIYHNKGKYSLKNFDPSTALSIHRNTGMTQVQIQTTEEVKDKLVLSFSAINDTSHLE